MGDFDFSIPDDMLSSRKAFRARIPGLEIYVDKHGAKYPIKDISALGMAILDPKKNSFREGEIFEFDLYLNKKLFAGELFAKVKRILNNGVVGCSFEGMDSKQEQILDKLVLEVQKRLIALKKVKAMKEKES